MYYAYVCLYIYINICTAMLVYKNFITYNFYSHFLFIYQRLITHKTSRCLSSWNLGLFVLLLHLVLFYGFVFSNTFSIVVQEK